MVGIARKKENSAAAPRERPSSIPPRIVEPERDGPGDDRQDLEHADQQRIPVCHLVDMGKSRLCLGAAPFDDDKCDTVDDQGDGHGDVIVKVRIEPIVQQEPDDRRRQDTDDDLEPQVPDPALFLLRLILAEGPQALPEQQHHRQDRPQLDNNLKHVPKLFGNIKLDKIIQQDQMSR